MFEWINPANPNAQSLAERHRKELAKVKGQNGITTLAEAMAAYKQQEGAIKQLDLMAQADLAESMARLTQLSNIMQNAGQPATTNAAAPSLASRLRSRP